MAVGCGTAAHEDAVTRARAWADSHGQDGRVTCSSGLKPPAGLSRPADFICLVRRAPLDCTVLHLTTTAVRVLHRHADCAQPL